MSPSGFNPHRPRRADATVVAPVVQLHLVVSILTGPEGPMQPASQGRPPPLPHCFNPHRPRRADATNRMRSLQDRFKVSILTGPEGPMQRMDSDGRLTPAQCFNPHRPRRADATTADAERADDRASFNPHRPRRADATEGSSGAGAVCRVSILTGPEGPMQRPVTPSNDAVSVFQSSPAPKGRCNLL